MYNTIGKTVSESKWDKETIKPCPEQLVIGYDEWDKVERTVRYRQDSNRFFDHPYTGAVYPKDRMHQWRPINQPLPL